MGRDPGIGKQRVLTGTAKTERAAHRLLHDMVNQSRDPADRASDATLAVVIEQWFATGGPAGEATCQVYAGYIRLHILPALGAVPLRKLASPTWNAGTRGRQLASMGERASAGGIRPNRTTPHHARYVLIARTSTLERRAKNRPATPVHRVSPNAGSERGHAWPRSRTPRPRLQGQPPRRTRLALPD